MLTETKENKKVLIVDDVPDNINILIETLENEGYDLSIAPNAEVAFQVIKADNFDLILLDIMMPEVDGFDVCRQLKSEPSTADIPIIFITAKIHTEDVIKGFELGAVDYITKPFQHEVVCARVKTHLKLKAALEEQIRLTNLKNKFLGIAAHDIRNPLHLIYSSSEILEKNIEKFSIDKTQRFLKRIHTASIEMLDLVDSLLDVSVIESGKLKINKQSVNLLQLIQSRIEVMQIQADSKEISFQSDLFEVPVIKLDERRTAQVLDNLFSNAIKFSPTGATITVNLKTSEQIIVIEIIDEGPGFTTDDQKNLFNYFASLSASPSANEKSTGLGLAIVKKIMDEQGGTIYVGNSPDKGAKITLSFPFH